MWDAVADTVLYELESGYGCEWSPDGQKLVATDASDRTLRVRDGNTGKTLATLTEDKSYLVRWSPDSKQFLTVTGDGRRLVVRDGTSAKELLTLCGHTSVVHTAEWSPDGRRILTASNDGTARVWDATAKPIGQTLDGRAVSFWSKGPGYKDRIDTFVRATTDKACELWEAETGNRFMTLDVPAAQVAEVRRSHDGKRVLIVTTDGTGPSVEVWSVNPLRRLCRFTADIRHSGSTGWNKVGQRLQSHFAELSPDCRFVAAVAAKGASVRVWDAENGTQVFATGELIPKPEQWDIIRPHWDRTGGRFFVEVRTGQNPKRQTEYRQWNSDSWAEVRHAPGVHSPDGKRMVTSQGRGGKWALVDQASGRTIRTLNPWSWCWWRPDGKQFILRDSSRTLRVYDGDTGGEVCALPDHPADVYHCDWSPDGRYVVTAASDTLFVWNAATGEKVQTVSQVRKVNDVLSWSPDCHRLMFGSWVDNDAMNIPLRLVVADLTGEKRIRRLPGGHTHKLTNAEWSPDGTRILTAGGDNSVRVLDPESGAELLVLKEPCHWLNGYWSKDGTKVVTHGWEYDGPPRQTLTVYDVAPKNSPKLPPPEPAPPPRPAK